MIDVDSLRDHARGVAADRLLRARGLLVSVTPDERRAIEGVAYVVADGVAECLLEEATRSGVVAAALGATYPLAEHSARTGINLAG